MTPVKLLYLLPLAAALTHGQNQCVVDLASQSDEGQSGFILSLSAAADSIGNCQLASVVLGLSVGDGKSLHTVQAPFSWQTGTVYTVAAVITAAGPQQLSINGQSAGSVTGAFNPAQGTLYASNVADSGTATEAYIIRQISLQVSNGSNTVTVAPNGNTPIPLPLVLLGGGPVSWQTALSLDPTKTTTVTSTFEFNATVVNPHQFDPYIDNYGQATAASWPSKITSDGDLLNTAAQEQAWLANNPPVAALDQYGGSTIAGWTGQATGYYYAAFHSGRWYMISPLGNPLFYLGITSIGDGPTAITGRESMFQLPPQSGDFAAAYTTAQGVTRVSFSVANQIVKYGSSWKAMGNTLLHQRFHSWGFGGGKFGTFPADLPSTPVLTHSDVPNAVPGGHPDAFDPNIVSELKTSLAAQMEPSVSSPYIVGWSVGNEIDEIIQSSEVTAILALGPSSPAKMAFVNQALNVLYGGSVSKLAVAWGISATSVGGVYAATNAQPPASDVESLRIFYEGTYYSILYKTIKSIDPNHVYFGIWILQPNNKDWAVVAANCDVVGFDDFNPSGLTSDVSALFTSTNKPVMIGAWVAATDYAGTRGFGWLPDRVMALSDSAAGDAYTQLLASFAANSYMVGSMIFQYGDGPLTGTGAVSGSALVIGGGDIAWGMVDLTDTPKYDLVNKVRAANIAGLQSLQLLGTASFSLSPSELLFSSFETSGALAPAGQTVGVTINGSTIASWFASADQPWVTITPGTSTFTVAVNPAGLAAGPHSSTITVVLPGATNNPQTVAVTLNVAASFTAPTPAPARFVPITPCRIADTRNADGPFGGPTLPGNTSRDFAIPFSGCGIPSNATAYSLNVAVVPQGPLGYLTLWPTGQPQPLVATLNSDGRVKSNAAIVPAGTNGSISGFVTNPSDIVIDINGYFVPTTNSTALEFFPVTPCRIADTRNATGPLGGPSLLKQASRTFPILSSPCGLPAAAQAYSLNFAAVPKGPLGYLTAWPTGLSQPTVASLNAPTGTVVANAVIVPSGTSGSIDVYSTDATDLVIDVNGYFAPAGTGGLALYTSAPCRVLDSRLPTGTPPFSVTKTVNVVASPCAVPVAAKAYVFNATVVPPAPLGYITMWPQGQTQPQVATLNASDGAITSNLAIVPTTNGSISVFPSNPTQLVLDLFGYFAP